MVKKYLQNPGRRIFLALGVALSTGYYLSRKSGKEHSDQDLSTERPVTPLDPDAVTVDSTQIQIGASDL